jgi:hypothetical protein
LIWLDYDARFRSLFLAYVAGTSAFGLIPRATLKIPGSARRLDRILALMESCQYSIHDLSRVSGKTRVGLAQTGWTFFDTPHA